MHLDLVSTKKDIKGLDSIRSGDKQVSLLLFLNDVIFSLHWLPCSISLTVNSVITDRFWLGF